MSVTVTKVPPRGTLTGVARKSRTRRDQKFDALPASDLIDCMRQCEIDIPEELVSVEVRVSADSVTQIIYTCNVTGGLEHKLGKAMQLHAVKDRLRR